MSNESPTKMSWRQRLAYRICYALATKRVIMGVNVGWLVTTTDYDLETGITRLESALRMIATAAEIRTAQFSVVARFDRRRRALERMSAARELPPWLLNWVKRSLDRQQRAFEAAERKSGTS